MAITGLVHVNVNCSDYACSLAFYGRLGFREIWRVPETSTPEVAAAVGMPPYRVKGALIALEGASPPFVIDLLEWKEPRDESPPYPHLYHLGIARSRSSRTISTATWRDSQRRGCSSSRSPRRCRRARARARVSSTRRARQQRRHRGVEAARAALARGLEPPARGDPDQRLPRLQTRSCSARVVARS